MAAPRNKADPAARQAPAQRRSEGGVRARYFQRRYVIFDFRKMISVSGAEGLAVAWHEYLAK